MSPSESAQTLLSMADLARQLALPESTVRYYCKRFAAFLPCRGQGRSRRYAPESLAVLQDVSAAMRKNKNAVAVELLLAGRSGRADHGESGALSPVALNGAYFYRPDALPSEAGLQLMRFMESQTQALQGVAQALENLSQSLAWQSAGTRGGGKSRKKELSTLPPAAQAVMGGGRPESREATPERAGDVDALHKEVQSLRTQLFNAEKVHQEDLEQLRKWLGRLGEALAKN